MGSVPAKRYVLLFASVRINIKRIKSHGQVIVFGRVRAGASLGRSSPGPHLANISLFFAFYPLWAIRFFSVQRLMRFLILGRSVGLKKET